MPSYKAQQIFIFPNSGQHLRMINKLQEVVEEMDKILSGINDIYAAGAVEGYDQSILPQFSTYRNVAFNAYACPHGSKYPSRRYTLIHRPIFFPKNILRRYLDPQCDLILIVIFQSK